MGYLIDWTSPGNRMALVYIMRAVVGSFRMAARRSHGDLVDTPNEPALALPESPKASETITPAKRLRASSGQTLFDVADLWAADGPKKTDAIEKTQRALRLLKESGQPVALHDTKRLSGLAFKRFLLEPERGFSGVTAGKHWHCVMAILNYAAHELAVIDANPWKGTAAPTGQASKCKVWSVEQLQRLFATSLFTAYELPEDRKAGADAAYWLQPRGVSAAGRGGFEIPGACPAEGLANGEALTITQAPGTPGGPSTPANATQTEEGEQRVACNAPMRIKGCWQFLQCQRAEFHKTSNSLIRKEYLRGREICLAFVLFQLTSVS
ncbi:MAG TPA: hypothetical protein VMS38_11935 [Pseudorhodoferax sp.]|nr:hypothetical protein [Pseudorhodoferax sp.]